ncbi:MAG TPA: maltose alpha-D-glucosyltransferase [Alphaproteobacteria bacterium]|nr:maltose alpha-D-glucosyltransferase [Alphaproteobacteria bacterium]
MPKDSAPSAKKDPIDRGDLLWFKDAVIYQAHVKALFDCNNDGVGDFPGFMQKLDYIKEMGVTAIWLLPFYPSPLRDDGYDISDYRDVHPTYGTIRDFREFIRACHKRNIRVIIELVINHTSDQHPWFQRARRTKPGSPYRDYYVWSDSDEKYRGTRIIFLDTEKSNWTFDSVAKAYYWHRFYSHQPDLNFDNPRVMKEVLRVLEFWLDMGVDGLRLDAVPYLVEREGTNNENLPETHEVLKRIRAEVEKKYPDRMLLAEANQWPEDVLPYFGTGDECHMAFHFPLMPRMYMSIAQEDRHPITDIMRQTPDIPENCQWAIFLRNHDELTLEMVTDKERDYLWNYYAADRTMRINLGIRRRLAPLLENDRRKIELMNGLLFALPGTPILYYGDEIGMGDNYFLGDRNGVRTPMQWSPDRNGGFSRADMARLYLPPIMDPIFGFFAVNVEAQLRTASSLLNWTKRILAVRQTQGVFGRGTLEFLYPTNRKILAFLRSYEGKTILCVFNLARSAQAVQLDLAKFKQRTPIELMGRSAFPPIGDLPYLLTLPAYGFFWFLLAMPEELPAWHGAIPEPVPEFITLVTRSGWRDILKNPALKLLQEVLPHFISLQRWFSAKDNRIIGTRILETAELPGESRNYLLAEVEAKLSNGDGKSYFMPLAIMADVEPSSGGGAPVSFMIAQVRHGPKLQGLYDAIVLRDFPLAMIRAMGAELELPATSGIFRFRATQDLKEIEFLPDVEVRRLSVEQSNSSILIGEKVMLKMLRAPVRGIHPEVELGFFLRNAGFNNTPPILGVLEHYDTSNVPSAFVTAHGFVRNQGDGWGHALHYLERWFEEFQLKTAPASDSMAAPAEPSIDQAAHAIYFELIATLGRRIGELHQVLARTTGNPAFDPEPVTKSDIETWREDAIELADAAFELLDKAIGSLSGDVKTAAETLLQRKKECIAHFSSLAARHIDVVKTRIHGDLHLGQVLVAHNDWYIIDFEGQPATPLDARRRKDSPLRDLAGVLRSFDYAAQSAVRRAATTLGEGSARALSEQAQCWRDQAAAAFIAAYREVAEQLPSLPTGREAQHDWLNFFMLEKAVYELRYEAMNRPEWLELPIKGITSILDSYSDKK